MGNFFEGKDFKKQEFRALIPKYYTPRYKKYISEEIKLLKLKVKGTNRILEAGVGNGRLIPYLAPLVGELVGIDNASLMLKQSRYAAKKFKNVRIIRGDLDNLDKLFPKNYFDKSLCVWNTLGNVKNEVTVLKELRKVTQGNIFITVFKKGTLKDRISLYRAFGVNIKRIDIDNEIFYSETGLRSKAYNLEDLEKLANRSGLKVKESRTLAGVILYAELNSK